MPFIDINHLDKTFGGFRALTDITIGIEEQEFVTFLGPSGCGKTTTLRLLAGFLVPDGGAIRVAGQLMSSPESIVPPERRRMGMVFQNYAVWPHMSVFDNVAFGPKLAKTPRREIADKVAQVLAAVGLEGLERRSPSQLSGGQQQRVALARSLIVEPAILLLDEPLSNLDAKLRERMRTELKSLQRRTGITFIYVTHDQAEAMALSDRIVVFHKGTVQQVGSPREVYERPANLFVADFMGLVNKLPGTLVGKSDGIAEVSVGRHRLKAMPSAGINGALGAVTLAVRPEAVRLGEAAGGGPQNLVDGSIVDATFLGNIIDYQVDIGGVTLRVQGERHDFRPVGETVRLAIPIRECVAMRDAFDPLHEPDHDSLRSV